MKRRTLIKEKTYALSLKAPSVSQPVNTPFQEAADTNTNFVLNEKERFLIQLKDLISIEI